MSLEAVLTGKISDPMSWYASAYAARLAATSPEEVWALGSIAEPNLLGPAAGTDGFPSWGRPGRPSAGAG